MNVELEYGLLEDKLVHVSQVVSGLECNCICPHCKSQLIARKGTKNKFHFSHYHVEDCNGGHESALHILAKETISKLKSIPLPLWVGKHGNRLFLESIKFDKVEAEKRLGDIIADVVVYENGIPFIIEVAVTHTVDEIKIDKIKKLGISAIEIDISEVDRDIDRDTLERIIVRKLRYAKWIYHVKEKEFNKKLEYEHLQRLKKDEERRERERLRKEYELELQRKSREREQELQRQSDEKDIMDFEKFIELQREKLHKENEEKLRITYKLIEVFKKGIEFKKVQDQIKLKENIRKYAQLRERLGLMKLSEDELRMRIKEYELWEHCQQFRRYKKPQ